MKQVKRTSAIMKIVIASAIILLTFFASFAISLTIKNKEDFVSETVKLGLSCNGSGTEEDPFLITGQSMLIELRNSVNTGSSYAGVYFKVTTNFVVTDGSDPWEPIGNSLSCYFAGVFDGGGHIIDYECSNNNTFNGLFGVNYGIIKNLIVSGSIDTTNNGTSTIKYIGGICGANGGIIDHCQNNINLTPTSSSNQTYYSQSMGVRGSIIGGIAGCSLPATSPNRDFTSAGYSMISITNCENTGSIYGNIAGGILGGAYQATQKLNDSTTGNESRTTFLSYNVNNIVNTRFVRGYIAGGILGTANDHNFIITNNVNIGGQVHGICVQTSTEGGFKYVNTWNAFKTSWGGFRDTEYNSGVTFGAAGGIVGSDFDGAGSYDNSSFLIIENNTTAGIIRSDIFTDAQATWGGDAAEYNTINNTWHFNNYTIGRILSTNVTSTIRNNCMLSNGSSRLRFVFSMKDSNNSGVMGTKQNLAILSGNAMASTGSTNNSDTYDDSSTVTTLTKSTFESRVFNSLGTLGFNSEYWNKTSIMPSDTSSTSVTSLNTTVSNLRYVTVSTSGFNSSFTKNIKNDYHTSDNQNVLDGQHGNGTISNPYVVNSPDDLVAIDGITSAYIMLTDNIDLSSKYWRPINLEGSTIDGRGFKITGLKCEEYTNAGLFTKVGYVKNLIIENCNVVSLGYSSPLTSLKNGGCVHLEKVEVSGLVSGGIETAGISFINAHQEDVTRDKAHNNLVSKCLIVGAGDISGVLDRAINVENCINGTRIAAYPNNAGRSGTTKVRIGGISITDTNINIYHSVSWFDTSNGNVNIFISTTNANLSSTSFYGSGDEDGILSTEAITAFDEFNEFDANWDRNLYYYENNEVPSLDLRLKVYLQGYTINQKYDTSNYVYDSSSVSTNPTWYPTFTSYKEDFSGYSGSKPIQDLNFNLRIKTASETLPTVYFNMVKGEQVSFTVNSNDLCMFFAYSTQGGENIEISKINSSGYYANISRSTGKGTGSLVLNGDTSTSYGADNITLRIYATDYIIFDVSSYRYTGVADTIVNGLNKNTEFENNSYHYNTGNLDKDGNQTAIKYGQSSVTMWTATNNDANKFPEIKRTGYTLTSYNISGETTPFMNASGKVVNNNYLDAQSKWKNMSQPVVYIKPVFTANQYTVTEIVNKNDNEYTKFNSTVKTDNYTNTTAQKSINVTYESTDKLDTAERYGYTFKGWYTSATGGTQLTDNQGKFINEVTNYTKKIGSKFIWIGTSNDKSVYAQFDAKYRQVNFDVNVDFPGGITSTGATLNGTKAYILMADYGYFDLNGASKLKTTDTETGLDSIFYKDTNFNTKYDKIIQTTPATYRFDGWYTQKDTSLTGPTGNLDTSN